MKKEDRRPKTEGRQKEEISPRFEVEKLRTSVFGLPAVKMEKANIQVQVLPISYKVTTADMTKSTTFVSKNDTFVTFYCKKWWFWGKT